MAETQQGKQEKMQELTEKIGKSIIDLSAEYEDDLTARHIFGAITFAAYCTISSMMELSNPGHREEWYENRSYKLITKWLTDYRSSIVDNPQETDSNK